MVTNKHVKASDIVITFKQDVSSCFEPSRLSIINDLKCVHYQAIKPEYAIDIIRNMGDSDVRLWEFKYEETEPTYHVDAGSITGVNISVQFDGAGFDVTVKEADNA
jgi:hypothetical protein